MAASNLSDVIMRDTHANLPVAAIPGRLYYETDTGLFWRDNGAAWESMNAVTSDNMISYSKTPVTVNPDNSENTLVDSLYFNTPVFSENTVLKIFFCVGKKGTHPSRYCIFVDNSDIAYPADGNIWYDLPTGESDGRIASIMCYITVTSGSHTIGIYESAAISTSSVQFLDRFVIGERIDGAIGTPVAVSVVNNNILENQVFS